MKESRRTKRMESHHKRRKDRTASLNMVSLMDIFTILVFFLLVNSSEVASLPNAKSLKLPESVAEKKPRETLVVMVNNKDILLQGHWIISVDEVRNSQNVIIEPLRVALEQHYIRDQSRAGADINLPGEVTIMGDKAITYDLLKKIMVTSSGTSYSNISLAVTQRAKGKR
ncbi:MAG: biopolymer transporter ExbD [Gammaproteobacteria bacterium]|nr:biopolymer transporter ExbD [Gammaproteobacteria bacterium]